MKLIKFLMIGIFIMATSCSETFIEEPDPVLKSGVNNPVEFQTNFKTYLDYKTNPGPAGDGWAFEQLIIGTGIAKHMGQSQMLKKQTVSGPMSFEFPFLAEALTCYVSANKDTLCFHTSGLLWPDPDLGWPNMISTDFQYEFLYGTGRFAKAMDGEIIQIGSTWDNDLGEGTVEEKVTIYF